MRVSSGEANVKAVNHPDIEYRVEWIMYGTRMFCVDVPAMGRPNHYNISIMPLGICRCFIVLREEIGGIIVPRICLAIAERGGTITLVPINEATL